MVEASLRSGENAPLFFGPFQKCADCITSIGHYRDHSPSCLVQYGSLLEYCLSTSGCCEKCNIFL